jgi:isoquinoline 1-oxidoreductase alpha subunit
MSYRLQVNGTEQEIEADGEMPLLWVLREKLKFTGTKFGCGIGACGACTVHFDGAAMRSCSVSLERASGHQITTIEGLASASVRHRVQKAWIDHQVPQCGYCQSGMVMSVAALLRSNPSPSDAEIDASVTNICRCGTYERIREAIRAVAGSSHA